MNANMGHTMILNTQWSKEQWDSHYLLALSHLNFDRPLTLLLLPRAIQECTWSDKQWQALSLFGLETCYHIKEPAPINSQSIDWLTARQLIIKSNKCLLHICHWKNREHFENWLPMVSKDDPLLIFGNTCQHDALWVSNRWPNKQQFAVNESTQQHIAKNPGHPHICAETNNDDHQRWTNLLIQYPTTLAWN